MPTNSMVLTVNGLSTRQEIRNHVITTFLAESPGTGKGDLRSKYIYYVETVATGNRIYLVRPTNLNKGMDFDIRVENIEFRPRGRGVIVNRPKHSDIFSDLLIKKSENSNEYIRVANAINRIYHCQQVTDNEIHRLNFTSGHPIEVILKTIKWLFIEQDITYWNSSGRGMFISGLRGNGLC